MGRPTGFVPLTEEEERATQLGRHDLYVRQQQRGGGGPRPPPPQGARLPGPPPPGVRQPGPHPLSGLQQFGAIHTLYNAPGDDESVERTITPLKEDQLMLTSPLVKGFSMETKRCGKSYSSTV